MSTSKRKCISVITTVVEKFGECQSCLSILSKRNIVTPLYYCNECTINRSKMTTVLEEIGIDRFLALLRSSLYPYISDWSLILTSTIDSDLFDYSSIVDPAISCVVHLLILLTTNRIKDIQTLLKFVLSIITYSCSLSSKSSKSLTSLKSPTSYNSPSGQLLCSSMSSWIRVIPLLCSSTMYVHAIKNVLSEYFHSTIFTGGSSRSRILFKQCMHSFTKTFSTNNNNTNYRTMTIKDTSTTDDNPSKKQLKIHKCTRKNVCLDRLPSDVIAGVIFSYLTPARIIWGCFLISKRFSFMCSDNMLWKNIYLLKWPNVNIKNTTATNYNYNNNNENLQNWMAMYIQRRLCIQKIKLNGWKLVELSKKKFDDTSSTNNLGKKFKRLLKRNKRRRKKDRKRYVVLCNYICGCNHISMDESERKQHIFNHINEKYIK
jgi:hypothetical protein